MITILVVITMDRNTKCSECNIKIGLFGFSCRCKDDEDKPRKFCSSCRNPKALDVIGGHICTFDYKRLGREEVQKNNPKLQTSKIEVL
jgi:hypothetical protein